MSIEEKIPIITNQERFRIRKLVYNQPDVLVDIFEALTEMLISKGVIDRNDAEAVLIAGIQNWRGGRGPEPDPKPKKQEIEGNE